MTKEATATGADVSAAIDNGAILLGKARDEIQFEILDLPRKGFLGLRQHPARVRVWIEVEEEKKASGADGRPPKRGERRQKKEKETAPRGKEETRQPKRESGQRPKSPKAPEEKPEKPPEEKEIIPTDEVREKVETAEKYVREILFRMGLREIGLTPRYYAGSVRLQLTGADVGAVIGRRGKTLDAIQYLASLVCNRGEGGYIRLSIDSGNYREKRIRTLENLAKKLASQAVRTGKSTTLEPMNPYERRIIHGAVSSVKGAVSSSVGVEPNRKVIISAAEGAGREEPGPAPKPAPKSAPKSAPGPAQGSASSGRRPRGGRRPGGRGGDRRRMDDPPVIGGPVRRERPGPDASGPGGSEELEKELLAGEKRYGRIDF